MFSTGNHWARYSRRSYQGKNAKAHNKRDKYAVKLAKGSYRQTKWDNFLVKHFGLK